MIYVASLSTSVKKAYGEKCFATTVAKIIEQMSIDPEVSGMNACVIGPRDVVGVNGRKLQTAYNSKHPDVCVIYLFTKDKEGGAIDVMFKKAIKKVTPEAVKEAVDSLIDSHLISGGKTVVSRDSQVTKPIKSKIASAQLPAGAAKGRMLKSATKKEEPVKNDTPEYLYDETLGLYYYLDLLGNMVYVDHNTGRELTPSEIQSKKDRLLQSAMNSVPEQEQTVTEVETTAEPYVSPVTDFHPEQIPVPEPVVQKPIYKPSDQPVKESVDGRIEKNIESIKDFHDWNLLKETLQKDTAVRELLAENSAFQGVVQMLSVLDTEIKSVFYDLGLSSEQKFEKILEIGGRRSTLMATHNDIISRKVLSIMEAVTISARRTVEEVLLDHRKAMEQLTTHDKNITNEDTLNTLIQRRVNAEFELLALIKGIISLYQAMDVEINDVILNMDKNLPSDNSFINSMVGSASDILTPTNTKEIAVTMMRALQANREQFSLLQDSVEKVIDAIHNLLERDRDIIERQQYMIKMLKAHRVEDVVLVDSLLKNILHVYVGQEGTGVTATTLTWSGCQSRMRNTLLVDLRKHNNLENYGVVPMDIDTFVADKPDRALCVVAGTLSNHEAVTEFLQQLKMRMDYYAYINVVCDVEDLDIINVLVKEALTVNYITNCTTDSMRVISYVYEHVTEQNVARKVLMIDPPIDVLSLANRMGVDATVTKCVTIPNVPKVKMCSVVSERPYEYSEVRTTYEEAFR